MIRVFSILNPAWLRSGVTRSQLYCAAGGITDSTTQQAFFTFEQSLISAGLLLPYPAPASACKIKALYPFRATGGTALANSLNFADPRNLDAAYRLTFPNGATHAASGIDWNGTNQYANTFLVPATALTKAAGTHLMYYALENTAGAADSVDMGAFNSVDTALLLSARNQNNGNKPIARNLGAVLTPTTAPVTNTGCFVTSRLSDADHALYQNGALLASGSGSGSLPFNYPIYIGAMNLQANGAYGYSTRACAAASIGDGLTAAEASAYTAALDQLFTAVGRPI